MATSTRSYWRGELYNSITSTEQPAAHGTRSNMTLTNRPRDVHPKSSLQKSYVIQLCYLQKSQQGAKSDHPTRVKFVGETSEERSSRCNHFRTEPTTNQTENTAVAKWIMAPICTCPCGHRLIAVHSSKYRTLHSVLTAQVSQLGFKNHLPAALSSGQQDISF